MPWKSAGVDHLELRPVVVEITGALAELSFLKQRERELSSNVGNLRKHVDQLLSENVELRDARFTRIMLTGLPFCIHKFIKKLRTIV